MKKFLPVLVVLVVAVPLFAQAVAAPTPVAVTQEFTDVLWGESGLLSIFGAGVGIILTLFAWAFITKKFKRRASL